MKSIWLIALFLGFLSSLGTGQEIAGVPIDPVVIDCDPGDPNFVATSPAWVLTAWEADSGWDFILTDATANEITSGWIDNTDPAEFVGFAVTPNDDTSFYYTWFFDETADTYHFEIDIVDDILGTIHFSTSATTSEIEEILNGFLIDQCGSSLVIGDSNRAVGIITIGAIAGIVATGGKISACAVDSLGQAKGGIDTCVIAFPAGTTNLNQCLACVSDKFDDDLLNCTWSFGWNSPDNDYPACITRAWAQPGGAPPSTGGGTE